MAISSRSMPRTTVDLDAAVLRDLKRLKKREKKPLGQLISELVAVALAREAAGRPFAWTTQRMGARVDLEDREAVRGRDFRSFEGIRARDPFEDPRGT
jgi:hypothetical protein